MTFQNFVQANALNIPLADRSVQMCVTSPPYWGLRDYRVDNQLGLERTPEEYVENMVAVFREVRRVLKDDGVLWIVIGDSYASDTKSGGRNDTEKMYGSSSQHLANHINIKINHGLKPKDLVGIPWRVAFALQADGWWLRSDCIWDKTNPMPESVTDRPTKAHEYIFLLTKSARYYYDADAVREPLATPLHAPLNKQSFIEELSRNTRAERMTEVWGNPNGRNIRTVWHVATAPYKGSHYATYPPKLIEPCILAGSKEGDIVLDPFNGSGTTGLVARKHGRNYIGTDLSLEYIHQAEERLSHTALKNWQQGKAVETTDLGPLFEVIG
jgi:DNA modification methylase